MVQRPPLHFPPVCVCVPGKFSSSPFLLTPWTTISDCYRLQSTTTTIKCCSFSRFFVLHSSSFSLPFHAATVFRVECFPALFTITTTTTNNNIKDLITGVSGGKHRGSAAPVAWRRRPHRRTNFNLNCSSPRHLYHHQSLISISHISRFPFLSLHQHGPQLTAPYLELRTVQQTHSHKLTPFSAFSSSPPVLPA